MLQVKIKFRLKFYNLGCFAISFVSQPYLFMVQGQETKKIENQPRLKNFKLTSQTPPFAFSKMLNLHDIIITVGGQRAGKIILVFLWLKYFSVQYFSTISTRQQMRIIKNCREKGPKQYNRYCIYSNKRPALNQRQPRISSHPKGRKS